MAAQGPQVAGLRRRLVRESRGLVLLDVRVAREPVQELVDLVHVEANTVEHALSLELFEELRQNGLVPTRKLRRAV